MSLFFLFVQLEFTHAIGPHAARYLVDSGAVGEAPIGIRRTVAGNEAAELALEARNREVAGVTRGIGVADVLVVGVVAAPASRPHLLRKARYLESSYAPAEVPLSVVTFVKGTMPLTSKHEAERRLEGIRLSTEQQDLYVDEALTVMNLAVRAYRAGTHDPYAIEVTRRDARRVRIGYGTTEDVQEGRWQATLDLPSPIGRRTSRIERLRPEEAVAGVLSGRSRVLESEDLLLRALIDLDNHRTRAAAYQVSAAMRLLPLELDADDGLDLAPLEDDARRALDLEHAAAHGELDDPQVAQLESIIDAVDDVLDAWRYEHAE